MSTPAPLPIDHADPVDGTRLRLVALALAGWHDHIRIPGSRVRGESGAGEPTTVTGRTSTRRRDELLLRLEAPNDENVTTIAAARRARRPGDLERGSHPFWAALEDAMSVLEVRDEYGHRLLVDTLVAGPLPGSGWRHVHAAIHALPFIDGGPAGRAVSAPKYRLIRALHQLDCLLADVAFPMEIREQVVGWEEWRQAMRATPTAKRGKLAYRSALRLQDAHIRELHDMAGWSQARIAAEFGVSQQAVSKSLRRSDGSGSL